MSAGPHQAGDCATTQRLDDPVLPVLPATPSRQTTKLPALYEPFGNA